jgi:hypothetical protein
VRFPDQVFAAFAEFARGATRQRFGGGGQQHLPGTRERHQSSGERLGEAFDFQRLRARLHGGFAVAPGEHFADVQSRARLQHEFARAHFGSIGEFAQAARVIEREAQAIDRAFEQQQQAVGAIDQAAAPALLQFEHEAVVRAEQFRRRRIAQAFDQQRGIAQVRQQQRADLRAGGGGVRAGAVSVGEIDHGRILAAVALQAGASAASCHSTRLPPRRLARYSAASASAYQSSHSPSGVTRHAPTLSVAICGGEGCSSCSACAVVVMNSATRTTSSRVRP